MRTLLLSYLSVLGGLTTVHAQHWVPYGFYTHQKALQKEEAPAETMQESSPLADQPLLVEAPVNEDGDALITELEADLIYFDDPESYNYADPDLAYGSGQAKKTPKAKKPSRERVCRPRSCVDNWWVEGDYLLAWMKNGDLSSPLITTGGATDPIPGAVGQPNTHVVFGDKHYKYHRMSGVKGAFGGFWGQEGKAAFDVGGFWIFDREKHFSIASDPAGNPIIARPFFDVRTGLENASLISNPGTVASDPGHYSGESKALIKTQLWGAEVNFGYRPCKKSIWGDLSLGFRYLHMREKLRIRDESMPFATPTGLSFNGATHTVPVGDTIKYEDEFRTLNNFYGGQVGLRADFTGCWASLAFFGKVALGVNEEKYKSDGETTWNSAAFGPQYAVGGILVQPNNQEHQKKWRFSYVPEVGADFALQPCDHIRLLVGYSFLYWHKVLRPGDQINRDVNSGQIPTSSTFFTPAKQSPSNHTHAKGFWLQTVNFGIMFDF